MTEKIKVNYTDRGPYINYKNKDYMLNLFRKDYGEFTIINTIIETFDTYVVIEPKKRNKSYE